MMSNFNGLKTNFLTIIFIVVFLTCSGESVIKLTSPSKNIKLEIAGLPEGLQIKLTGPNHLNMSVNAFGFVFDQKVFTAGYVVESIKQKTVNNQWKPVCGGRNLITNRYQQAEITLADKVNKNEKMEIICRIYDEGMAFRYRFPAGFAQNLTIEKELTTFSFDKDYEAWASSRAQSQIGETTIDKITSVVERPLLIKQNDSSYLALGEAALVDFARMKFLSDPEMPNTLQAMLDGKVDMKQAKYVSPWRYAMVAGSPGKLLENNFFILNLNEPNQLKDTSWIKPGKVIREVTLTTQGGIACVDFAAAHHLQYVEFDAGWYGPENDKNSDASTVTVDPNRSSGPLNLQKVIEYAEGKNIGIILYVNHLAMEKQLDQILPLYRSWGVKGVKYGFVNVGSQKWTSWLHEAVRKAAQNHLMVDIHDEYRPTGYSRTYPNLMTQEGIRGDEESPSVEHSIITLFTRGLAGAGDNTNCYFADRVSQKMGGKCGQMAKAILLFSPWQFIYWYDRPVGSPHKTAGAGANDAIIKESPDLAFYDALPTVWDDTRVLEGQIGKYATVARRSGNDWFIGSLNAGQLRKVEIPLTFLDKKVSYEAEVFYQDEEALKNNTVKMKKIKVDHSSILNKNLLHNSGFATNIRPL